VKELTTKPEKPSIMDKATVENTVVLTVTLTFVILILCGLGIACTGGKIDAWQTVALFFSGFYMGILTAFGLFKAPVTHT